MRRIERSRLREPYPASEGCRPLRGSRLAKSPARPPALFLLPAFAIAAACGPREDVRVAIDTRLVAPRTVLEKAKKLELRVLEGGTVSCDPGKGTITDEASAKEIARQDLGDAGCASGIRFCGNLSIEKSDAERAAPQAARG